MNTKSRLSYLTLPAGSYTLLQMVKSGSDGFPGATTGQLIEQNTTTTNSVDIVALQETIISEDPKKKKAGYCWHSRIENQLFTTTLEYSYAQSRYYRFVFSGGYAARTWLYPRLNLMTDAITVGGTDWKALSFQAMQAMRPDLSDGLNMAAFVGELGTPKSLVQKWQNFRSTISRNGLLGWLNQSFGPNGGRRGAASMAAGLNLWYQYGLAPFISDLKKAFQNLKTLEKRLQDLKAIGGKTRTKHWSRNLDIATLPVESTVWTDSNFRDSLRRKYEWISRPVYHATLTYTMDMSNLDGLLGKARAYVSTLGFDKVLSTAWELTKFSFLIDWFIDVSGFLESVDNQLFGAIPITVQEFCHSVKFEYQTTIFFQPLWYGAPMASVPIGMSRRKLYERRVDVPTLTDLQSAKGLTVNRAGLAASLIAANNQRRR